MSSNRAFIESLLLGTSGDSPFTMTLGRFHLHSPDATVDDHPSHSAERTVEVVEGAPDEPFGSNRYDGYVIEQRPLTVRIRYLYTRAGGDGPESLGEQDGAATLDAIRDRASADASAIDDVLQWHGNYQGSSPRIITINKAGPPSPIAIQGDRVISEIPYVVTAQRTTGTNL